MNRTRATLIMGVFIMTRIHAQDTGEKMPEIKTIAAQPSWVVKNNTVELAVTQLGGHMAPVLFCLDSGKAVQPYYISPWQGENLDLGEPVLVPLRGDFFCLPFGGNAEAVNGVKFPVHGEPAGSRWALESLARTGAVTTLSLSMETTLAVGRITKNLSLVDSQNVVYVQHVLEGYGGKMPLGHHATLALPEKEGAVRVSTSAIKFGMTSPGVFSDPAKGEYPSLATHKTFADLEHVPLLWKEPAEADVTSLPARTGFADLLAVFSVPAEELKTPAWVCAVNTAEGYLWYALKDPAVLPAMAVWIENRGRHGVPWNGRNRCVGLEDVCAYFAEGMAASVASNQLNAAGIPTAVELSGDRATVVNYIQGVVKVPRGFDRVKEAAFSTGKVTFVSFSGSNVTAEVHHEFLKSGKVR